MERKIVHVRDNVYKLEAKPSIDEFFDATIRGELRLSPVKENITVIPGTPTGITLPQ